MQEWGDLRGTPVFLLHGTPGSRLGPRPRDTQLYRQGIRLIGYDRPGYGSSTRLKDRRIEHAAADVARIADCLGIDEFTVVGRSGGAPHALACGALLPERVRRVAALVSLAPPDAAGLDWFAGMSPGNVAEYRVARRGPEELARRLEQRAAEIRADPRSRLPFGDDRLPESDRTVISDYGIKNMLVHNFTEGLRTSGLGWVDDCLSFIEPWGFEPGGITVPVLLWHGAQDIFSPVSHTHWLAERIKHAEVSVVPGAAHFGAIAVLPAVLRWLKAAPDAAAVPLTAAAAGG